MISGPPPWTITGFSPTYLSRTTSRGEGLAQLLVAHRRAAVLDHHRAPVELPDVGEGLEKRLYVCVLSHVVYSALIHVVVGQIAEVHVRHYVAAAECRPRAPPRAARGEVLGVDLGRAELVELLAGERHPGRLRDPAPVRVASEERRLHQRRVGDRACDPLGLLARGRSADLDPADPGRALTVGDDFERELQQ